jgi:hypothetical protein
MTGGMGSVGSMMRGGGSPYGSGGSPFSPGGGGPMTGGGLPGFSSGGGKMGDDGDRAISASSGGGLPRFPGGAGGPGSGGPMMAGASGGGGLPGSAATQQEAGTVETTWWYNDKKKGVYRAFLFNKDGRVIQMQLFGYKGGDRTKRGVGLGSTLGQVIQRYNWTTDGTRVGDNMMLRYGGREKLAFQ